MGNWYHRSNKALKLRDLLFRQYGTDFSFQVFGGGHKILASSLNEDSVFHACTKES